jgi:hypothetical protein
MQQAKLELLLLQSGDIEVGIGNDRTYCILALENNNKGIMCLWK